MGAHNNKHKCNSYTYLGLAGPLEVGTVIGGGGSSVGDVRSFPGGGRDMSNIQFNIRTNLGLAGPLEEGTEIGGSSSVGDVRSFPAEGGGRWHVGKCRGVRPVGQIL